MLACDHDWQVCSCLRWRQRVSKAAAPRVLAVDVDGMIHPVTAEILSRAIQQAKQEDAVAAAGAPEYAGRPDGCHARVDRKDRRLAHAGGHLCGAQRRARGLRGILHAGSRRRRRHGAGHQYRRGASRADGRRDGPGHEAEGRERCGGLAAQHRGASAGATARWPRKPCARASRSPTKKRSTII